VDKIDLLATFAILEGLAEELLGLRAPGAQRLGREEGHFQPPTGGGQWRVALAQHQLEGLLGNGDAAIALAFLMDIIVGRKILIVRHDALRFVSIGEHPKAVMRVGPRHGKIHGVQPAGDIDPIILEIGRLVIEIECRRPVAHDFCPSALPYLP